MAYSDSIRDLLRRACAEGHIIRLLPGVYCASGAEGSLRVRAAALALHDPSAVIVGRAAAALTWWPENGRLDCIEAVTGGQARAPGYRWLRQQVPEDHVIHLGGVRVTDAALTVLDLIPELGGHAIDEGLRRRAVRLSDLERALAETPGRPGNVERRRLLADSVDEPWSEAERSFHTVLRRPRLSWPYRTNYPVRHPGGRAFVDAAVPKLQLGFEIDGREFRSSAASFAADRIRDANLALAGWRVHRFAAVTVRDDPTWLAQAVEDLVAIRAAELGRRSRRPSSHR